LETGHSGKKTSIITSPAPTLPDSFILQPFLVCCKSMGVAIMILAKSCHKGANLPEGDLTARARSGIIAAIENRNDAEQEE